MVVGMTRFPLGPLLPQWAPSPVPPREVLHGRFCRVEPLAESHAPSLWAANARDADGGMWTYMAYGPWAQESDYRTWVVESARSSDPLFFAIIDGVSGQAVGVASYLRLDPHNGVIEVGHLAYSPLLQRTPAATEAMYLMMARIFALGYRRYEWKCHALNAPSRMAAQRFGFSYEGLFRQAAVVKGRSRDTAWYSIIDTEWSALRAAYERWLDPVNFDANGRQRIALSTLTSPMIAAKG